MLYQQQRQFRLPKLPRQEIKKKFLLNAILLFRVFFLTQHPGYYAMTLIPKRQNISARVLTNSENWGGLSCWMHFSEWAFSAKGMNCMTKPV